MKLPKIQLGQKPTFVNLGEHIDFYELFEKIEQSFDVCFILESLGQEGRLSRYSIIGFDPSIIIHARDKNLFINNKKYIVKNPYFALREIMPQNVLGRNYAGGLVGYLSYDAVNYFEPSLHVKVHPLFDQFKFGVYTDGLILDKATNETYYFYYDNNRLKTIKKIMRQKNKKGKSIVKSQGDTLTKKEHAKAVEIVKEHIKAGNTFQCEVGFKTEFTIKGDTRTIYGRLRKINPSPFMYYVKFFGQKIIGASPELLFRLRNGEMETFPLAGTARRGKNEKEDKKLARQLLRNSKEIAEHNMLVDLHRNDMGRVSEFGTVKVRNSIDVKRFSHVQHIASEIVGILRQNEDMFSALAANFPAGTLTGAPKIESIKIIDRLEPQARGPYGGALGHFGFNGDCTFAIPIRTLFIDGDYGYTQTCGGIVYDSVAQKEYREIQNKLAAMKEACLPAGRY